MGVEACGTRAATFRINSPLQIALTSLGNSYGLFSDVCGMCALLKFVISMGDGKIKKNILDTFPLFLQRVHAYV